MEREDPIARSYASALFALGVRDGVEIEYGDAVRVVATLLEEEPVVRHFLETPRIPTEDKKEVFRSAFEGRLPGPVVNFLLLVLDKRRQEILRNVAWSYRELLDEKGSRVRVQVEVAHPLDDESLSRVVDAASKAMGKEVVPEVRVDPDLIGGVVLRRGDMVFDGSIRRRLRGLRSELLAVDVSQAEDG